MINLLVPAFKLISGYPMWFVPLCLLFGAGVALLLYFKNTSDDFSKPLVAALTALRFVAVSIIAFLLLSPMIRTLSRTVEKPAVIIGVDNSRSMILGADSLFVSDRLPGMLTEASEELKDKFDVYNYTFGRQITSGDALKHDYKEEISDISAFLSEVNARFYNRNVGAVVLVTDGIFNAGQDPLYVSRDAGYPVYTVKTGDTTVKRDLIIQKINYNRTAFKGNRFPIEVVVHAREAGRMSSVLKITSGNEEIFSEKLDFTSDNQVKTVSMVTEAEETGIKKYRISLEPIEDEVNTANNVREIFIEIKEGKQRVAIVGNAPHPDLAALERAISSGNHFEADLFYLDNFKINPSDYNLLVLHQIPSLTGTSGELNTLLNDHRIPVLFILGSQSDLISFNKLKTGLSLLDQGKTGNESLPLLNNEFTLFVIPERISALLQTVSPLISPFARYQYPGQVQVLAYQGIGSLKSDMPLILFNQVADTRYGIIAGEGIWKWRIHDYALNSRHSAFDELMGKIMQYLAADTDRNRLKLTWRNSYAENESIEFNAILLNESGEIITDPEIELVITGEDNSSYDFSFSVLNDGYYLNAGNLPPGIYSFSAVAKTGTGDLKREGSFTVTALNLEDINTVANHRLLNALATRTGGEALMPEETGKLAALLIGRDDAKPVIYSKKHFTDLVSYGPLLGLILLLLTLEWFLRRYHGSY